MGLTHLLRPADLGGIQVRNRLVMPTHGPRLFGEDYLRYLEERARGGIGLAGLPAGFGVGDAAFVPGPGPDGAIDDPLSADGRSKLDDRVVPMLAAQVERLHALGVACVGQLHHGGANRNGDDPQPAVAPSVVVDPYARNVPHVLRPHEIDRVVATYAEGARRVRDAGADGVELHAGHGYLIHQFLSPVTNRRDDDFGGDAPRRRRFLDVLLDAVREQVGSDYPIGIRLNGGDGVPGGLGLDDVVEICRWSEGRGVAYLNVSGGTYSGWRDGVGLPYVAPPYVGDAPNVDAAAAITAAVGVPVIATGRIVDLDQAEAILADGRADLVGLVRALIAEPRLLELAQRGEQSLARRCVGGNECHVPGRPVVCAVNPLSGREARVGVRDTRSPRRVLVVGGGVAGMEAATVAAARGHQVTLVERTEALGGVVADLGADAHRPEFARHVEGAEARLAAAGVEVRLGTEADVELVADVSPHAVVVATGSRDLLPAVRGIDALAVHAARDVLAGRASPLGRVVVHGGLEDAHGPLVVADRIAADGQEVILVTELPDVGPGLEPATRFQLLQRLARAGVTVHRASRLVGARPGGVELLDVLTREHAWMDADAIVGASGRCAQDQLADRLRGDGHVVHVVGDALAPRRIVHAIGDALRVAALV